MSHTVDAPPTQLRATPTARRIGRPLQYIALAAYVVFLGFPLLFLLLTAFKTPQELISPNPTFLPETLRFDNFTQAIEKANLVQAAGNSLLVAVATTLVVTVIALPAAYALARFRTKLRTVATGWILLSQVFPFILIIIPLFLVLKQIGLINNLLGLVLVYTVWSLPFALWMLQGYVAGIPVELEEAGAMDGGSRLLILRKIVLPLLAPGLVATSLFTFIGSWNEFFFALVLIQDPSLQTLPLTLARFVGAEGQVQLGQLAAASLLATIPSLVFFAIIQRRLTSGLLSGAVKG
jgi:multiple sugar transport system permease protein